MDKEQLKRKYIMLRLVLKKGGWNKAELLKKYSVFHHMGEHCYYHPFRLPAEPFLIGMGDNVFIGTGVSLVTHSMENCVFNYISQQRGLLPEVGKIEFGNNVFVGANATIMYGVHIGDNCIVAANSVVTHDVPNGSVVAGIPAKVIGSFEERCNKFVTNDSDFKLKTKNIKGTLWDKQKQFCWEMKQDLK